MSSAAIQRAREATFGSMVRASLPVRVFSVAGSNPRNLGFDPTPPHDGFDLIEGTLDLSFSVLVDNLAISVSPRSVARLYHFLSPSSIHRRPANESAAFSIDVSMAAGE